MASVTPPIIKGLVLLATPGKAVPAVHVVPLVDLAMLVELPTIATNEVPSVPICQASVDGMARSVQVRPSGDVDTLADDVVEDATNKPAPKNTVATLLPDNNVSG